MKTKYRVLSDFNKNISHEYDVEIKDKKSTKLKLKRSNNPEWTSPKETIVEIKDDGNGIIMNGEHYEYHVFAELFVAMKALIKYQSNQWCNYKIVKNENNKQSK